MKTILVPTDHSPEARHALQYALELAAHTQSTLVLLHVFHQQIPVSESMHLDSYIAQLEEKKTRDLEAYAQNLQEELTRNFALHFYAVEKPNQTAPVGLSLTPGGHHYLQANPISEAMANLPVKSVAVFGDASQQIVEAMQTVGADLVVMGMRGTGAIGRALLGSVATQVMLKATVPVLAVPLNKGFQGVSTIAYGVDLKTKPRQAHLSFLQDLAKAFASRLLLLHLYQNQKNQELERIQESLGQLDQGLRELDFTVYFQDATEVSQALERFASEHHADLLVVAPQQHTYLDILRNKSVTGAISAQLNLPLLALPTWEPAAPADALQESVQPKAL